MPALGSRSESVTALNQVWELDSTRIDVMCADGKRYVLVAAIDVWSRRAMALVTPESRASAIGLLIRRCLLAWGVPDWIVTDEGADYTSRHVRRILGDLEVGHEVLPPYSPDQKPFIERWIRTLSHGLLTQLAGFVGHNVAQAKRLRDRTSFAARRGDDRTVTFRASLTPQQLQERIDGWCEHVYARDPHGGLGGISPFERAASWRGLRRTVDERGLDILLAEAAGRDGRRKVGKQGIGVDGGMYIAGELGDHMDEWVHVRRDPADYGTIHVFTDPDRDGRSAFICVAFDRTRTDIDRRGNRQLRPSGARANGIATPGSGRAILNSSRNRPGRSTRCWRRPAKTRPVSSPCRRAGPGTAPARWMPPPRPRRPHRPPTGAVRRSGPARRN